MNQPYEVKQAFKRYLIDEQGKMNKSVINQIMIAVAGNHEFDKWIERKSLVS